MSSTDYQKAPHRGAVDEVLAPCFDGPAPKPISGNRLVGSLKDAASWPGADRNTVVTLALLLVAARADEEGSRYFQDLSERNPADATAQALAGFFQVRAGHDVAAAVTKLDKATTVEPGLPQYFRGLALAELLPGEDPSEARLAPADTARADQVIADLEFVLAARDQFPVALLRAAYQGLARAYLALGRQQQAAEALRRSGLQPTATDRPPMFTSFSLTARDGVRLSAPRALSPAPGVHVAQSYDFGDFAFIETSAGLVAIDTGTSPDRVLVAMADLGLKEQAPVSHLMLTHAHFDHVGGAAAVCGPDTQVIASAAFPAEAERERQWSPPVPPLDRDRCQTRPRCEARSADQRAVVACRRRHRVRPDSGQGWRDTRRADGPPARRRAAVHRRRDDALPRRPVHRRGFPGGTAGNTAVHPRAGTPAAHPWSHHAD
jgi:Metallo-beta-lactamase superfamily